MNSRSIQAALFVMLAGGLAACGGGGVGSAPNSNPAVPPGAVAGATSGTSSSTVANARRAPNAAPTSTPPVTFLTLYGPVLSGSSSDFTMHDATCGDMEVLVPAAVLAAPGALSFGTFAGPGSTVKAVVDGACSTVGVTAHQVGFGTIPTVATYAFPRRRVNPAGLDVAGAFSFDFDPAPFDRPKSELNAYTLTSTSGSTPATSATGHPYSYWLFDVDFSPKHGSNTSYPTIYWTGGQLFYIGPNFYVTVFDAEGRARPDVTYAIKETLVSGSGLASFSSAAFNYTGDPALRTFRKFRIAITTFTLSDLP